MIGTKIVTDTTKTNVRQHHRDLFTLCFASICLIAHNRLAAKHRDDKERKDKDKEETKVKEESAEKIKIKVEPVVKMNHTINEGFHYNLDIKHEVSYVCICVCPKV